ncbi:MAG: sterol desaturase family protein [Acidobacteriota bacterium]
MITKVHPDSPVIAFLVALAIFGIFEALWPAIRGKRLWRAESGTDLGYWFFTPLVSKTATRFAIALMLVPLALLSGVAPTRAAITAAVTRSRGPMAAVPDAIQVILVLVLGDFMAYGMHRLFHRKPLWAFHAVHHGSRTLDWLSSVRLHPVNEVLTRVVQIVPFYLLGFKATILAVYAPFLTFLAVLIHANVPWSFGPLRKIVASPTFHRWHHTSRGGRARQELRRPVPLDRRALRDLLHAGRTAAPGVRPLGGGCASRHLRPALGTLPGSAERSASYNGGVVNAKRPRAEAPVGCPLAERLAPSDSRGSSRARGDPRLLDLLLNQLPPHAARAGTRRTEAQRRALRGDRRPLAEVPQRARRRDGA